MELLNIFELDELLKSKTKGIKYSCFGLLFCFGTSLISRAIQMKTREYDDEVVPSHVAILFGEYIFESTTSEEFVNHKKIHEGVRMWMIEDFIEAEKNKLTKYYVYKMSQAQFDVDNLMHNLHLPYGRDTIVDFVFKNKSNGDKTHGLICSQYANKCTKLSKQRCPSPADLFRIIKDLEKKE